jgi:SET domain-containing protein
MKKQENDMDEAQKKYVEIINKTVKTTLGQSKIHGIGVIAITDIKEGERLFETPNGYTERRWFTETMLNALKPEIKAIILDRTMNGFTDKSPNEQADMQCFMNHSKEPNSNGHIATKDIQKGEEVTEDYSKMGIGAAGKEHYKFIEES